MDGHGRPYGMTILGAISSASSKRMTSVKVLDRKNIHNNRHSFMKREEEIQRRITHPSIFAVIPLIKIHCPTITTLASR
jgi:hypothetical protein